MHITNHCEYFDVLNSCGLSVVSVIAIVIFLQMPGDSDWVEFGCVPKKGRVPGLIDKP